jgi:hypothetical protein
VLTNRCCLAAFRYGAFYCHRDTLAKSLLLLLLLLLLLFCAQVKKTMNRIKQVLRCAQHAQQGGTAFFGGGEP